MELRNEDNPRWYGKGERGPPLGRRSATLKAEGEGLNPNSKTQSSNQCQNGNNKSIPNVKTFTPLDKGFASTNVYPNTNFQEFMVDVFVFWDAFTKAL